MHAARIDRRAFIASAGAAFVSALHPRSAHALDSTGAVFASAYRDEHGAFGLAILSAHGDLVETYPLPARGHDVVANPAGNSLVVFARRPGIFAVAMDMQHQSAPIVFNCAPDRHFYGHGCFSSDGRLLYATENDFEGARGVIGIYDATYSYQRIGELSSGGVGPHDMHLLPDGRTLVIANGGIETHPDYPRAKLNLASMEPNLAFVDTRTGDLLSKATLSAALHRLSIRHLAMQEDGTVWFACQNQADQTMPVPLAGSVDVNGNVRMLDLPDGDWAKLRGYVGSIACSSDGQRVVVTSPRGGVAVDINTARQSIMKAHYSPDVCGVSVHGGSLLLTSGVGNVGGQSHNISFDNHVSAFRMG